VAQLFKKFRFLSTPEIHHHANKLPTLDHHEPQTFHSIMPYVSKI